jgi:hypothetical protein
MIIHLLEE